MTNRARGNIIIFEREELFTIIEETITRSDGMVKLGVGNLAEYQEVPESEMY